MFPLVIASIVCIIYIAFFLHDKVILNTSAYLIAMRASEQYAKNEQETEALIQQYSIEYLQNRLFAAKDVHINVDFQDSWIIVSYQGNVQFPFSGFIKKIYNRSELKIVVIRKSKVTDPVAFIRRIKTIQNLIE